MKLVAVSIAAVALATPALAAETLCRPDEKVVFSCSTSATRFASLCGSKTLTKTSGYLQYRFGQKDKPEIVYPAKPTPPAGLFKNGSLMFSGGGGNYYQFSNGGYRYTLFSAIGNWNPKGGKAEVQGVAVARGDQEIANLPCRNDRNLNTGDGTIPVYLEKADIADAASDFDIPEAFFPK